jgi:single-stranded DNA-binding protein
LKTLNRVEMIVRMLDDARLVRLNAGLRCAVFSVYELFETENDRGRDTHVATYHCVAWNKLADICYEFTTAGFSIYLEGHLATRHIVTAQGRTPITEVIVDDLIIFSTSHLLEVERLAHGYFPDAADYDHSYYVPPTYPDLRTCLRLGIPAVE